jgi:hypothetical protein
MLIARCFLAAAAASLGLAGCSFFMPVDTLKPRAAFDLKCAEAELKFVELGGDCGKKLANEYTCTIGVQGCGQQVTYIHVPRGDWVMNVATQGPKAAPK